MTTGRNLTVTEAARKVLDELYDIVAYEDKNFELGYRPCCHVLEFKPHTSSCPMELLKQALFSEATTGIGDNPSAQQEIKNV